MLRSGLPHVCKTCLLSLHMKNISYLKNTVRMRNLFKNWPIWGIWDKTGTPQGLWIVRVCKRSPELTRQHGFMGVGHTPELLELKKPGTGDRDGLTRTHHRVAGAGVQMALIFFPLFFFSHLRKCCSETAYGTARLIVSLWPLREEGEKIKLLDRVLLRSCCFNLFSYILSITVVFFLNKCST